MKRPSDAEVFTPITPQESAPKSAHSRPAAGEAELQPYGTIEREDSPTDAAVIARHVFNAKAPGIASIDYAIEYRLADGYAGGDVVDAYEFDNGSVALIGADVEGRGVHAAVLAALIKFALRGYASAGMTPEATVQALNRLYIENCAFEDIASFASVFFAHVDANREIMGYCSAGHDVVLLMHPDVPPVLVATTAPIIGVFSTQHELFGQRYLGLKHGTILVIGTDGITESRNREGQFFGSDGFKRVAERYRHASMSDLASHIIEEALHFSSSSVRDDIAVLAVRFH